jgi:transposase
MMMHGSDGATALFDMAGFAVGGHVLDGGEWWLLVETTTDVIGCPDCGVRAVGHGRRRVQVRDLPIAGRPVRLVCDERVAEELVRESV